MNKSVKKIIARARDNEMKVLFTCAVCICFAVLAYAQDMDSTTVDSHVYVVEAKDIYAYFNEDGKWKEDKPVVGRFEIDEKKGVIKESNTIINFDGQEVDAAKYNPVEWEIIANEDGNIIAVRLEGLGEDMLCFRNDGTYYLFQAFHNVPMVDLKFAGGFFYGKYKRIEP